MSRNSHSLQTEEDVIKELSFLLLKLKANHASSDSTNECSNKDQRIKEAQAQAQVLYEKAARSIVQLKNISQDHPLNHELSKESKALVENNLNSIETLIAFLLTIRAFYHEAKKEEKATVLEIEVRTISCIIDLNIPKNDNDDLSIKNASCAFASLKAIPILFSSFEAQKQLTDSMWETGLNHVNNFSFTEIAFEYYIRFFFEQENHLFLIQAIKEIITARKGLLSSLKRLENSTIGRENIFFIFIKALEREKEPQSLIELIEIITSILKKTQQEEHKEVLNYIITLQNNTPENNTLQNKENDHHDKIPNHIITRLIDNLSQSIFKQSLLDEIEKEQENIALYFLSTLLELITKYGSEQHFGEHFRDITRRLIKRFNTKKKQEIPDSEKYPCKELINNIKKSLDNIIVNQKTIFFNYLITQLPKNILDKILIEKRQDRQTLLHFLGSLDNKENQNFLALLAQRVNQEKENDWPLIASELIKNDQCSSTLELIITQSSQDTYMAFINLLSQERFKILIKNDFLLANLIKRTAHEDLNPFMHRVLKKEGKNNAYSGQEQTLLSLTIQYQDESFIEQLMLYCHQKELNLIMKKKYNVDGETLCHLIMRFCSHDTVKRLLNLLNTEPLIEKDFQDRTPLYIAAQYQSSDLLIELINIIQKHVPHKIPKRNAWKWLKRIASQHSEAAFIKIIQIIDKDSLKKAFDTTENIADLLYEVAQHQSTTAFYRLLDLIIETNKERVQKDLEKLLTSSSEDKKNHVLKTLSLHLHQQFHYPLIHMTKQYHKMMYPLLNTRFERSVNGASSSLWIILFLLLYGELKPISPPPNNHHPRTKKKKALKEPLKNYDEDFKDQLSKLQTALAAFKTYQEHSELKYFSTRNDHFSYPLNQSLDSQKNNAPDSLQPTTEDDYFQAINQQLTKNRNEQSKKMSQLSKKAKISSAEKKESSESNQTVTTTKMTLDNKGTYRFFHQTTQSSPINPLSTEDQTLLNSGDLLITIMTPCEIEQMTNTTSNLSNPLPNKQNTNPVLSDEKIYKFSHSENKIKRVDKNNMYQKSSYLNEREYAGALISPTLATRLLPSCAKIGFALNIQECKIKALINKDIGWKMGKNTGSLEQMIQYASDIKPSNYSDLNEFKRVIRDSLHPNTVLFKLRSSYRARSSTLPSSKEAMNHCLRQRHQSIMQAIKAIIVLHPIKEAIDEAETHRKELNIEVPIWYYNPNDKTLQIIVPKPKEEKKKLSSMQTRV